MDKKVKKGLSLRKFDLVMFASAVLISVVMFVAMQHTTRLYDQTSLITTGAVEIRGSAYNMQVASDYMTEQIRSFVITGEKKYLENYFEEINVTKRREESLDTIKKYNMAEDAFKELNEAMVGSLDLMDTEYYAARLAIDAYGYNIQEFEEFPGNIALSAHDEALSSAEKKELAESMLFDEKYLAKKDSISGHMESCLEELSEGMESEQRKFASQLRQQVFFEHVLTGLLIAILLGIVIVTTFLVINPLMRMVELIRDEKTIPIKGVYEVRFLARTFNLFYYSNMEKRKKLVFDASHDKLTGLYNRRGYDFIMENIEVDTSALILIDLDKFKEVNDTYGHDVGDGVLVRAADFFKKSFRDNDYLCRLGGDEFAILLTHVDKNQQEKLVSRIEGINKKMGKGTDELPGMTMSVGIAYGKSGAAASELFKAADLALYEVKENGRCGVYVNEL